MSQSKMISVPQIARMDDIRKTSTSIKEKKRSKLTRVVRKWTNEEDERMALLVSVYSLVTLLVWRRHCN